MDGSILVQDRAFRSDTPSGRLCVPAMNTSRAVASRQFTSVPESRRDPVMKGRVLPFDILFTVPCVLLLSAFLGAGGAPATPAIPQAPSPITNDDVIAMVKAGVAADSIMSTIDHAKKKSFDLSKDGRAQLTAAGVSSTIIDVMRGRKLSKSVRDAPVQTIPFKPALQPPPTASSAPPGSPLAAPPASTSTAPAAPTPPVTSGDPNDPLTMRVPGVYVRMNGAIVPLPASQCAKLIKSGGLVRVGSRAGLGILDTHAAQVRVPPNTEFLFYFDPSGASAFGGRFPGASNPRNFGLMKATVTSNDRRVILPDPRDAKPMSSVAFAAEQLAPGVFKVKPSAPLAAGEWAFALVQDPRTRASDVIVVIDFGVDKR
jgi:hypothetical protein